MQEQQCSLTDEKTNYGASAGQSSVEPLPGAAEGNKNAGYHNTRKTFTLGIKDG